MTALGLRQAFLFLVFASQCVAFGPGAARAVDGGHQWRTTGTGIGIGPVEAEHEGEGE